jgi:hypothetical protein
MREFSSAPKDDAEPLETQDVPFKLDDAVFHATIRTDAASILAWSEMAASADPSTDLASQEGVAFINRYFNAVMDRVEYQRLRAHMRKHETHPDVLMEIMQFIEGVMLDAVEGNAERPTMPPSGSSGGRTEKEDRLSLLDSLSEDGEVVVVPRPNRQQRRAADRRQAVRAG